MSAHSPKHRIQRLKKEIEDLDHQIKSSNPIKRSLNLPLSLLHSVNPEREELQQKLTSMRVTASSKEQTLHSQLKGIQQNLRASALKKQNEVGTCKSYRETLKKRIEELKANLQKYHDDFTVLSTSLEEKRRMIENSAFAKAKVYSESLLPLENDAKALERLRKNLERRICKLEDQENIVANRILMCREEWQGKYRLKVEMIAMREESEVKLEVFCKEFHDEIEFFKEEDEFFRKVVHVHSLQGKYREELSKHRSSLAGLVVSLDRLSSRLEQVKDDIKNTILISADSKLSNEILKLEQTLRSRCENLSLEPLETQILDLNVLEGFDIDEEVLKIQLTEVKSLETQLRQEFEFEETSFSESLIIRNYQKLPTDDLEETFRNKKILFRNRVAAIGQWKEEVEAVIFDAKLEVPVKDKTVVQEFFASLGKLSPDLRKELESLANSLLSKLTTRDKSIQTQLLNLKEKHVEKMKLKEKFLRCRAEVFRVSLDILRSQQQVLLLCDKEKTLVSEYRSSNTIIQELLSLQSEVTFFEGFFTGYAKSTEILAQVQIDLQENLKALKREITLAKLAFNEASDDLKTVFYQIEKINDKKGKNLPSTMKNLDDEKIAMLKGKIEETSAELASCVQEFNSFENEFQAKLSIIEQEESMLRSQQQAIESALRNFEIEAKRIQDMESQLGRLEESDDAPNPETLKDQNRSKSAAKMRRGLRVEDLYTTEIKDGDESSSIVEGNQFLELVVKPLGRGAPIVTDRSTVQRTINKKYYRFNLEDISSNEVSFLEKIRPLLEGSEILKKFISKSKIKNFDILDCLNLQPEQCGYAARHFFLHKTLGKIEVKQPLKPGFESTILTESLLGPVLSPNVLLVLKAQGHLNNDELDYDKLNEKIKDSVNFDVNSERFKDLCRGISLYPFSISLAQGDKVELVARGYGTLKQWVNGINALTKYKRYIPKLRSRIEAYTTV
jgi:hypothetical protein